MKIRLQSFGPEDENDDELEVETDVRGYERYLFAALLGMIQKRTREARRVSPESDLLVFVGVHVSALDQLPRGSSPLQEALRDIFRPV